ncbi:MAG: glycosyltransferase [Sphingobacteriales bacterium]|nr:glycosyltransferase [Sphingobacteriales bacterium]
MEKAKYLWLTSWYPNRNDRFDGDFIQRHAQAVSTFCEIHVIHVQKEVHTLVDQSNELNSTGNLTENIIYYSCKKTGIAVLDKWISHRNYIRCYKKAIATYILENGKPAAVHVHVAMKAGLLAVWIKQKWNIPFVVSEQWTGYLNDADNHFKDQAVWFQRGAKQVFHQASAVTVVSDFLGKSIKQNLPFFNYTIVPNLVNTSIFTFRTKAVERTVFIHISNMTAQKNVEDIIRSMGLVKEQYPDVKLKLFGPINPDLKQRVISDGLQQQIIFMGEQPQSILAQALSAASALILYSRFETFGCVVIEANACGIPVIVSDIAVMHELVQPNLNGMLVKGEAPQQLAEAMIQMIKRRNDYHGERIASTAAERYGYATVGKQFLEIYHQIS